MLCSRGQRKYVSIRGWEESHKEKYTHDVSSVNGNPNGHIRYSTAAGVCTKFLQRSCSPTRLGYCQRTKITGCTEGLDGEKADLPDDLRTRIQRKKKSAVRAAKALDGPVRPPFRDPLAIRIELKMRLLGTSKFEHRKRTTMPLSGIEAKYGLFWKSSYKE